MKSEVWAAVKVGPGQTELRQFLEPDLAPDEGLLQVAAAGICGSDVQSYPTPLRRGPHIMGHENVGHIAKLGPIAEKRWGLHEGDYVLLEEYLPCGHCEWCRSGKFRLCNQTEIHSNAAALRLGSTPVTVHPSLWGGFSQLLYLHPASVFHRVPKTVSAEQASLALPLGNGWEWTVFEAGVGPGKRVWIMGPGQQGLGCVIAAKEAGARQIFVSGLARDAARLQLAAELGADCVINVEAEDAVDRIMAETEAHGVDVVIDVAAASTATILPALKALAKGGILVLAAGGRNQELERFPVGALKARYLRMIAVRGHSYQAVELALATLASGKYPLDRLCSHRFGLDRVNDALRTAMGESPGESPIHVTVIPGA